VAEGHYLQVTDAHYASAIGPAEGGAESGAAHVGNDQH
jgi:hypothetical protein